MKIARNLSDGGGESCEYGWTKIGDECYHAMKTEDSFWEQVKSCEDHGGSLVTEKPPNEEQPFLDWFESLAAELNVDIGQKNIFLGYQLEYVLHLVF